MRLYKKAAACLLTAAMAISMLTACGGGGNGGNGGGNTPSTLPDPDQIVLPAPGEGGEGGGEGGAETKPTKTPIAKDSSKLAEFNKKYAGATEFYVEMQMVEYDEDGYSTDGCTAAKGNNAYMKMTVSRTNQKQQSVEQLMLREGDYNNGYVLLRDSKVAVRISSQKSQSNDNISLDTLITDTLPDLMWSTKVKVGPTEYDAEIYNNGSTEHTICFTADGKPVYRFVRELNEKQLESATLYKTIQAGSGTSKGLCEMPDGFKKYSFDFLNKTLTDVNGNVFTLEPQKNNAGDVTSVKVLDKDKNDVSDDFKWAYDLYMLFK